MAADANVPDTEENGTVADLGRVLKPPAIPCECIVGCKAWCCVTGLARLEVMRENTRGGAAVESAVLATTTHCSFLCVACKRVVGVDGSALNFIATGGIGMKVPAPPGLNGVLGTKY